MQFYVKNTTGNSQREWKKERDRERRAANAYTWWKYERASLLKPGKHRVETIFKNKGQTISLCYPACLLPYSAFSKLLSHTIQYNIIKKRKYTVQEFAGGSMVLHCFLTVSFEIFLGWWYWSYHILGTKSPVWPFLCKAFSSLVQEF